MRRISTRFSLVVGILALAFSGFVLYRIWWSTRAHMESLVAHESRLALEFDLAIRQYARDSIRPEMTKRVGSDEFVPEAMSTSYIARSIFEKVHERMPEYVIKFSSAHPRNLANQAGPEELRMLRYFEEHPEKPSWTGPIELDGKPYFAQLSPMRAEKDCLECHGRPEDARAELVARYGPTAGFNYRQGDIVGMDMVAAPLEEVQAAVGGEVAAQLVIVGVWLVVLFGSIFLAFRFLVGRRLAALAAHFQRSAQQLEGPIASVPIKGNDEIGILATSFNALAERLRKFHASLEELVAQRTAALQAEIVERKRAEEALEDEQRILRKLLEIHERQQKLVATEIHDNLTQPLTGALMSLDTSRRGLQHREEDGALAPLERARELLAETIGLSRRLMSGLRPPILDDLGPIAAIESLVAESQIVGKQKIDLHCQVQFDRLSPNLETIIFRIVQESLRNAQQHSHSDRVEIRLLQIDDQLRIEVQDWGVGFTPATAEAGHFGLESIRERCRLLGGEAVITSAPGQGTLLRIDLPLIAPVESTHLALGDP